MNYRDVIFQEISWFQEILLEVLGFQEILPCTKEYESTFFQEILTILNHISVNRIDIGSLNLQNVSSYAGVYLILWVTQSTGRVMNKSYQPYVNLQA